MCLACYYHPRRCSVSIADCSAIALAERLGAELVTSDAPMLRVARACKLKVVPVPDSTGALPR